MLRLFCWSDFREDEKDREREKWSKIGIFEFLVRKENKEENWWSLYVFFLAHPNVISKK